jgi:hypothetical protein
MNPELVRDMLNELRAACIIIRNARSVMSDVQADEWGQKNVQDSLGRVCSGRLETTRNTSRVNMIILAEKALSEAAS